MTEGVYEVLITHERKQPVSQFFRTRGYMLFADVARFDAADQRVLRLLGFDQARLHNLRRRDFSLIADRTRPAAAVALGALAELSGISADRVFLLANAAVLGYVFNPVSFFFFYRDGMHVATIAEVNNTFGEQKHFVLPASREGKAAVHKKDFYVSPFISPLVNFSMRIAAPAESLSIGIHTLGAKGKELAAEMGGRRRELSDRMLLLMFLKYPLHTLRVIALIHWYALKLFFNGVPHYPKAGADAAVVHKTLRRQA